MIDEIIAEAKKSAALAPTSDASTARGKIERLRFALARFDAPFSCTNVEVGFVNHKEDCDECAGTFLEVVASIIAGEGLPGENQ